MFNFFKKKRSIINPYTLPNSFVNYYCRNIIELRNKLKIIDEDIEKIYYIDFPKKYTKRHEYFTNYDETIITNITDIIEEVLNIIDAMIKKYKIKNNSKQDIDALTRINYILVEIKNSFDDIIK